MLTLHPSEGRAAVATRIREASANGHKHLPVRRIHLKTDVFTRIRDLEGEMSLLSDDDIAEAAPNDARCSESAASPLRLTRKETRNLDALAKSRGVQRGELIRQLIRDELATGRGHLCGQHGDLPRSHGHFVSC